MPAASAIRDYLMPYVGVTNPNLLDPATSARMLTDLNAALQEMYTAKPLRRDGSAVVRGPTAVVIDALTQYDRAITFEGFEDWMLGCTIRLGGDSRFNKLALNSRGEPELENPYMGSTTTNMGGTVYADCINLDSCIAAPYPPVLLDNQYVVDMLNSRQALNDLRTGMLYDRAVGEKPQARPRFAIIEDVINPGAAPKTRFLFEALPDRVYVLTYDADVAPPRVESWGDTRTGFLHSGKDESLLWPWVRFKFSSWPHYIGDRREAAEEFQRAAALWNAANPKGYGHTEIPVGTW